MGDMKDVLLRDHPHGGEEFVGCGLCFPNGWPPPVSPSHSPDWPAVPPSDAAPVGGFDADSKARAIFRAGMNIGAYGLDTDGLFDVLEELYSVGYGTGLGRLIEAAMKAPHD